MSDKKELTIVTLQIELPTRVVGQLPEVFWPRLCITVADILRLLLPNNQYAQCWRSK